MEDRKILNLSNKEFMLLRGSLLTSKEILQCTPFKTKDIKNKILEINTFLEKINLIAGS